MIAINKSRRRLLKIVGVAAVGAIVGKSFVTFKDKTELKKVTWNGIALGSQAEITIYHPSEKEAHKILTKSVGELTGLENLFSLYKDSSQLSLLNKKGYLENPHPEMVNIFNLSKKYSEMTNGAFDVTVQPLWNIYNKSFTDLGKPPSNTQISNALKLVDWKSIKVEKLKLVTQ